MPCNRLEHSYLKRCPLQRLNVLYLTVIFGDVTYHAVGVMRRGNLHAVELALLLPFTVSITHILRVHVPYYRISFHTEYILYTVP